MLIPDRTPEELKQIAIDLRAGRIFSDRHIPVEEVPTTLQMVFMPLTLMSQDQYDELKANPPGMIYEYLSEAGPRSCNGFPGFFSMRFLSQPDTEKVLDLYKQLETAEASVKP